MCVDYLWVDGMQWMDIYIGLYLYGDVDGDDEDDDDDGSKDAE